MVEHGGANGVHIFATDTNGALPGCGYDAFRGTGIAHRGGVAGHVGAWSFHTKQ